MCSHYLCSEWGLSLQCALEKALIDREAELASKSEALSLLASKLEVRCVSFHLLQIVYITAWM